MEANTFHQQEVGAVLWHLYHKTSGREFALEDQLVLFWHHCADQAAKFRAINNFHLQKKVFIRATPITIRLQSIQIGLIWYSNIHKKTLIIDKYQNTVFEKVKAKMEVLEKYKRNWKQCNHSLDITRTLRHSWWAVPAGGQEVDSRKSCCLKVPSSLALHTTLGLPGSTASFFTLRVWHWYNADGIIALSSSALPLNRDVLNSLTSASPAPDTTSSSEVSGTNFVQKMLAVCPVSIECKSFRLE